MIVALNLKFRLCRLEPKIQLENHLNYSSAAHFTGMKWVVYFLVKVKTYSFLPGNGTFPVHQIHGSIRIFSGHSNKTLFRPRQTQNIAQNDNLIRKTTFGQLGESAAYEWMIFSPGFALLWQAAKSDARHCFSSTPPCGTKASQKHKIFISSCLQTGNLAALRGCGKFQSL